MSLQKIFGLYALVLSSYLVHSSTAFSVGSSKSLDPKHVTVSQLTNVSAKYEDCENDGVINVAANSCQNCGEDNECCTQLAAVGFQLCSILQIFDLVGELITDVVAGILGVVIPVCDLKANARGYGSCADAANTAQGSDAGCILTHVLDGQILNCIQLYGAPGVYSCVPGVVKNNTNQIDCCTADSSDSSTGVVGYNEPTSVCMTHMSCSNLNVYNDYSLYQTVECCTVSCSTKTFINKNTTLVNRS